MQETTITCDCCGKEMEEENHFELKGVLSQEGASKEIDESKTLDLEDLCEPCASAIFEAIDKVHQRMRCEN